MRLWGCWRVIISKSISIEVVNAQTRKSKQTKRNLRTCKANHPAVENPPHKNITWTSDGFNLYKRLKQMENSL